MDIVFHRISNIDEATETGICAVCGPTSIIARQKGKRGPTRFWQCRIKLYTSCNTPRRRWRSNHKKKSTYRRFRTKFCTRCGFIPEDICQLDIHHIDGNHKNNSKKNLQTLCANCHRLVTKEERQSKKDGA